MGLQILRCCCSCRLWCEWLENDKWWTKMKNPLDRAKAIVITFHPTVTVYWKYWPSRTIEAIVACCFYAISWNAKGDVTAWESEIKYKSNLKQWKHGETLQLRSPDLLYGNIKIHNGEFCKLWAYLIRIVYFKYN